MTFAPTERKTTRRNKYLKIVSGIPTVMQILDAESVLVYKHWITDGGGRKVGLRCPGQDICPICLRNREINYDRKNPLFVASQRRYRINVLNLTPVKRCPECNTAYISTTAPETCTGDGCGASLVNVEATPLKEVQILERGRRLMEQFDALESAPHPFVGKPVAIQSYPIMLVATGAGRDMVITAVPQAPSDEDVSKFERYDLSDDLILEAEEIQHLLDGGLYKDVLAARQAEREAKTSPPDVPESKVPF